MRCILFYIYTINISQLSIKILCRCGFIKSSYLSCAIGLTGIRVLLELALRMFTITTFGVAGADFRTIFSRTATFARFMAFDMLCNMELKKYYLSYIHLLYLLSTYLLRCFYTIFHRCLTTPAHLASHGLSYSLPSAPHTFSFL